jgi:hypothetical protein
MAKRRQGLDQGEVVRSTIEWNEQLDRALSNLGAATLKFPSLFPKGVNKIDLQLELKTGFTFRLTVEGPSGNSAAMSYGLTEVTDVDAFEMIPQSPSLLTASSPTEGGPSDQAKLISGVSLEGAAKVFVRGCLGQVSTYPNNCAHYLSNALIIAGYSELASPLPCVTHRCGKPECISGGKRPTRANDMRCWFLAKDANPMSSVKKGSGFYAVYQERQSDGQGHVVILDSNAWKFYGTGWCETGQPAPNDWKHQYFRW